MSGYVTLDYCVKNAIVDVYGNNDVQQYQRFLQWAIRTVKDLNFMGTYTTSRTIKLEVDANTRTAELPPDYVDWTVVGQKDGEYLIMWGYNPHLLMYQDTDDCGDFVANSPEELDANAILSLRNSGYFDNVWRNGFTGGNFGVGGGQSEAYFNIDRQTNRIYFSTEANMGATILLEYVSTGYEPGGQTKIPSFAAEAVIEGIHWRRKKESRSYSLGEKEYSRNEFFNRQRLANMWDKAFTLGDFLQAFRRGNKQSPKY